MSARRRPLRVLVVEDEPDVRSFIAAALEDEEAEVAEAGDALEAVDILTRAAPRHFDVVIVDCILPGATDDTPAGLRLLETIKTRWPWLPTIGITGADSSALVIQAFRSGARDFLAKPFRVAELTAAIARVTRRRTTPHGVHPVAGREAIERVRQFIEQHYDEPMSRDRLAARAGMSISHFSRTFRAVTGMSLRGYVRSLRLARAQELLVASGRSLGDIAVSLGFYDLPHFDKAFRERFGISPTEYRRRAAGARAIRRPPNAESSGEGHAG